MDDSYSPFFALVSYPQAKDLWASDFTGLRYIPRLSVASIVRKLKQESVVAIWKKHKPFLSKNLWKEHSLWSDGYFVSSIGEASPETIRNYILNQGWRWRLQPSD